MAAAETIVALSTPPGRGAIAVVRLSGPQAVSAARSRVRWARPPTPRRLTKASVLARDGALLDEGLVAVFPAPDSYTGEDVVEISVHGSPAVASELILGLVESGARVARPGEFTERAFVHGKLDLSQAEAVRDLVESETAFQARVAYEQLEGALSRQLRPTKEGLVQALVQLETAVEFSEEEVELQSRKELRDSLAAQADSLRRLEDSFDRGQVLRQGLSIAFAGRPNSGKSSLFNALLGRDRAIVTDVAGTTRDAVQEALDLNGVPARLIDTAGIRETEDLLERMGLEKTRQFLSGADVALFVVDGSREWGPEDELSWSLLKACRCLLAVNKSDLDRRCRPPADVAGGCFSSVEVSALTGAGLEALREAVWADAVGERAGGGESGLLTNARHKACVSRARAALERGVEALEDGLSEEFAAFHLQACLQALGEITGETTGEEVLGRIFSQFCIGK